MGKGCHLTGEKNAESQRGEEKNIPERFEEHRGYAAKTTTRHEVGAMHAASRSNSLTRSCARTCHPWA